VRHADVGEVLLEVFDEHVLDGERIDGLQTRECVCRDKWYPANVREPEQLYLIRLDENVKVQIISDILDNYLLDFVRSPQAGVKEVYSGASCDGYAADIPVIVFWRKELLEKRIWSSCIPLIYFILSDYWGQRNAKRSVLARSSLSREFCFWFCKISERNQNPELHRMHIAQFSILDKLLTSRYSCRENDQIRMNLI